MNFNGCGVGLISSRSKDGANGRGEAETTRQEERKGAVQESTAQAGQEAEKAHYFSNNADGYPGI
jgi:hypothetical protein